MNHIFYNFYLYLSEKGSNKSLDYDTYLEDLINSREYLPSNYFDFVRASDSLVKDIFNNFGIVVQQVERPSNLSDIRRIYDNLLGNHPKGNNARENDILCMYYLSDQSNFVNAETGLCEEPYLITLDTTITPMRKKFVEDFKRSFWYIYPPIKFANRLSLMDLKLDSKSINYDVICMAETNFKASYETISMLDIMTMFFKSSEIGDKKLPRLLAQMKAEEKNDDHLREYSEKNNNNLPIDVVLNDIHSYYRKSESFNLENVSQLFEMDELSEQILSLLKEGCENVLKDNHINERIYKELDTLVEQHITSSNN